MKLRRQKIAALFMAAAMALSPMASAGEVFASEVGGGAAESEAVKNVKTLIEALPELSKVTEGHRQDIEAALAAYNALSEEEQTKLDDKDNCPPESGQPYGRNLESAVWGLEVLKEVDNSTTLSDGTYNADTTPKLSSSYSKGKSTSSRDYPWSLKEVTVKDGKAFATVTTTSTSYTSIRTNGVTYNNISATKQPCEFENVPVDLNGTMYIAAYSTQMKSEIGFIVMNEIPETFNLTVANDVRMFLVNAADMTVNGGQHSKNYMVTTNVTMGSDSFDEAYIGTASEAEAAKETIALSVDRKFQFTLENAATIGTVLGKATIFSFHSVNRDAWYERVMTFDKAAKTLAIIDSAKADYAKVDAAIAKIPADLSIYTKESAAAVTAAKDAVITKLYASQQDKVDAMAKAIEDAIAKLVPVPEEHTHTFGDWKTVSKATVFEPEKQERTCTVCGEKETKESGKALTPTIKLNVTKIPLKMGQSTTAVKVSGLANGDSVKSWTTKDTSIVKVDKKSGKITAKKKKGTATVTVTLASGKTAKVTVTVQSGTVKTTKLSGLKKSVTLEVGDRLTLEPVVTPVTSQQKVTYTSSKKSVAAVSQKGVVTARKSGTARITVKSGSKKLTVTVKVQAKAPTAIKNIPASKTLKKGKTLTLKPKFSPSGSTAKVTYSSSDKKVATVNSKGKITAKKKGTAVITVKAGKLKAQCKITVK